MQCKKYIKDAIIQEYLKVASAININIYCQQRLFKIIRKPTVSSANEYRDHAITSADIKICEQTFPENDLASKVFKSNCPHFRHLNINSILLKIEQLRSLLINSNISVLGITETKLDRTVNNENVKIDGCNLIQSDRNRKGGEIACYRKSNIFFNHHGSLNEN